MARLTKQAVDAAGRKRGRISSGATSFAASARASIRPEKKSYYADYRNRDGVRKRMKIGDHGKITTEEARKLALQLSAASTGEDPANERATRRNAITVKELCADYMAAADRA